MYYITTETSFDAAHFLKDYEGKCKNIHGHRWRVVIKIQSKELLKDKQHNELIELLKNENFELSEVEFRPTAENFSKYFYDSLTYRGYQVAEAMVYETPNNMASYCEK